MEDPSLYETVLADLAGGAPRPPVRVRPSASVALWRRRGGELEVYWIERAPSMAFMGGWHAFPGGGVSSRDHGLSPRTEPFVTPGAAPEAAMPEAVTDGLGRLAPILAPGVAVAALRELFEETGVLPGLTAAHGARLPELRAALGAREIGLAGVAAATGVELDASRLVYAGRWLTPPLGPLRFDNRFFLLEWDASEDVQPQADGREAVRGEWIRPADAIALWRRGRVITAPPILHILRVLDEEGPVAGLPRLEEPAEENLGPFRRIEFRPGVVLLPLRTPTLPPASYTNCYLLGTRTCVLVDPGSAATREVDWLAAAVAALAERHGRPPVEIWLTHHHPDHVGGAAALARRLGLPIAAHAETARRLAGRLAVDREIADGETRRLGGPDGEFTVRALHTPGHARGHLCFLHEELGSLLAGDVLAGLGTIVIDPPEGDMTQYLATLDRLIDLAPRTLFPAHGPVILDALGKLREYREHRRWREEKVLRAWRRGLREAAAMVPVVYEDAPRQAWRLAERQIVAHLERLQALGRLTARRGAGRAP